MDVLCHLWLPLSKPPTLAKSQVLRAEVSLGFALGLGSQPSAVQGLLSAPSSAPRSRRWHCAPLEVQGHSPRSWPGIPVTSAGTEVQSTYGQGISGPLHTAWEQRGLWQIIAGPGSHALCDCPRQREGSLGGEGSATF